MAQSLAAKIKAANWSLIAEGNLDSIAEFFTPDYLVHFNEKDTAVGHKVIRQALELINKAFPQVQVEVEILVERDNRIAWMRTLSGVQEGSYKGFPASNRKIVWREMVTSEFRDGLIAREWVLSDLAERLLLSRKR
jgi:predicted ester cyclase